MHAMLGTKRGAHLALSLARLDMLCPKPLQRIGLSATLEDTALAARWLSPDDVYIAAPKTEKRIEIKIQKPYAPGLLPEGTVWPEIANRVIEECQRCRTVIAFVENRAQAERLAYFVNRNAGEGFARAHHGSISKEQRQEAEDLLRAGQLKLLAATSSMELGIDVGEIDKVLQIGCPRTVSSLLQRLGRAGHRPGLTSAMVIYPRMGSEALFCGMTAELARRAQLEPLAPHEDSLDILAQHLVSMSIDECYTIKDVLKMLRRSSSFSRVTEQDIRETLETLAGDYEHAREIPVRPRLLYDRLAGTVRGDAYSRMLALSSGGTIPDRGMYAVKNEAGVKIGEMDEECVFEARDGDKFMLGSFAWRVLHIDKDSVTVVPASREGAQVPFWRGDGGGRHVRVGLAFGEMLRELAQARQPGQLHGMLSELGLDGPSCDDARWLIERQLELTGALPDDRTILLEHFADEAGQQQLMVHCVLGKRVNEPLALLCRAEARRRGHELDIFADDDGFLLFPRDGRRVACNPLLAISPENAEALLTAMLPATPAFGMVFRYNAAHALLMGPRGSGRTPLWIQRMRAAELLNHLADFPDHPLTRETRREVLRHVWDLDATVELLRRIQSGQVALREVDTEYPSPLSIPLRRQVEFEMTYDYHPVGSRVAQNAANELTQLQDSVKPPKEMLQNAAFGMRPPEDEQQLHSLLMTSGDLVAGEAQVPGAWLESLARQGRALAIEPGLWIAREEEALYAAALEQGDAAALQRLARRLLRYRGGQTAETVAARYDITEERAQPALDQLVEEGLAILDGGEYFHKA